MTILRLISSKNVIKTNKNLFSLRRHIICYALFKSEITVMKTDIINIYKYMSIINTLKDYYTKLQDTSLKRIYNTHRL